MGPLASATSAAVATGSAEAEESRTKLSSGCAVRSSFAVTSSKSATSYVTLLSKLACRCTSSTCASCCSCPSVLPHGLSPPLSRIAFFPARACRERFAFAFDFGRGAALLPRMISICGVRTLLCRARLIATLTRSVAIPAAARRAGEDRT
jgi:hypothetical protein